MISHSSCEVGTDQFIGWKRGGTLVCIRCKNCWLQLADDGFFQMILRYEYKEGDGRMLSLYNMQCRMLYDMTSEGLPLMRTRNLDQSVPCNLSLTHT
jgi:hypothetical protein